jgi:hypothetical protein
MLLQLSVMEVWDTSKHLGFIIQMYLDTIGSGLAYLSYKEGSFNNKKSSGTVK